MNIDSLGIMVRELRRQKDLTMEQLSALSGVPAQTLGRIERGMNWASTEWLDGIARALNVPVSRLFQEEGTTKPVVHYRSETRLTEKSMTKVEEMISLYSRLEDLCRAKKYQSFHLDIPLVDFNESLIEEAAEQSRELLGIRNAIIYDLINLMESNGLRILVCEFPKEVNGFSYYSPREKGIYFFLNVLDSTERKIFTLAHEFGHLIFHQGGSKYRVYQPNTDEEVIESAAKYFASCFLMPERAIRKTLMQLGVNQCNLDFDLLLSLKKRFGVSAEAFILRLSELDIISRKQRDSFVEAVHAYYNRYDFREPSPAKIVLSENQRIKDLLWIGGRDEDCSVEVKKIREKLSNLGMSV